MKRFLLFCQIPKSKHPQASREYLWVLGVCFILIDRLIRANIPMTNHIGEGY